MDLSNFITGTTRGKLTKSALNRIEILLPSFKEQEYIANILDKAQYLVDKRKQAIAKLNELVQAVFMDMFGNPVTNPMGWEVQKLKSLSTKILSGNTPKGGSQVYVDKGIIFFRSQNIWKNRIELDDVAYIDEQTHWKMSQTSVKNRDILITKTGRINTENSSLGRAALFLGEDDSANINGHVYLVRLKKGFIHEFVLYILITDEYRDYIREVCVGGIDKRQINKEHLEEFPIIMPPIDLQQRFADYVRQIDKLKSKMQQELKDLESNFQALLQKAFKGELKVKDGVAV
ncbi:restriction endonuclease subunit S [Paenibacillus stellifer]|nr:restriction endonuclease subunit S [Paenibacillus stellifer]